MKRITRWTAFWLKIKYKKCNNPNCGLPKNVRNILQGRWRRRWIWDLIGFLEKFIKFQNWKKWVSEYEREIKSSFFDNFQTNKKSFHFKAVFFSTCHHHLFFIILLIQQFAAPLPTFQYQKAGATVPTVTPNQPRVTWNTEIQKFFHSSAATKNTIRLYEGMSAPKTLNGNSKWVKEENPRDLQKRKH